MILYIYIFLKKIKTLSIITWDHCFHLKNNKTKHSENSFFETKYAFFKEKLLKICLQIKWIKKCSSRKDDIHKQNPIYFRQ